MISPTTVERIWPWNVADPQMPAKSIACCFCIGVGKSGHLEEAKSTIDVLGPHLTDENIDLIYHIGMV